MNSDKQRIIQLEKELKEKNDLILELQNSINELIKQIRNLTEIILQMRHNRFGSSGEKNVLANMDGNQLCLFNEAEVYAKENEPEPFKPDSKGKAKENKRRTRKDMIVKDIPTEEVLLELEDKDLTCDVCESKLKPLGKQFIREEIQYIPAQLKILKYYRKVYECPSCKHKDKPVMAAAVISPSLLNHSIVSSDSVAWGYVQGVPLYRQEKDWERMGLLLSRATIAN